MSSVLSTSDGTLFFPTAPSNPAVRPKWEYLSDAAPIRSLLSPWPHSSASPAPCHLHNADTAGLPCPPVFSQSTLSEPRDCQRAPGTPALPGRAVQDLIRLGWASEPERQSIKTGSQKQPRLIVLPAVVQQEPKVSEQTLPSVHSSLPTGGEEWKTWDARCWGGFRRYTKCKSREAQGGVRHWSQSDHSFKEPCVWLCSET